MKIAVIKTGDAVDGPGEGEEIAVYELEGGGYRLIEVVENPAKYARAARGIAALAEARRLGAGALVASEIGPRGFAVAQGWGLKIYIYQGSVEGMFERLAKGELAEARGPTHGERHHVHGHVHGVSEDEYALILKYLPKGGAAADLGCGAGRFCDVLKDMASLVYCVDINKDILKEVEKIKANNIIILNEDLTYTSISSDSIDLVIMSNVLHDIADKEAAAREAARVLRAGGHVVVIEHKPGMLFGPPNFVKLKPDEVRKYFNNLKEVEYIDLNYNYAIIFKK